MSSGFPPFQPYCVLWFPEVRVGLLCMLQTKNCLCLHCRSIWKLHRTWVMCGNVAFCGTLFIMKSCLEGFRDNCKCHWGEWEKCRLCTASFTHCCFPDSPASLCHLHLLLLHLQKSTLLLLLVFPHQSRLLLLVCPGANARLWLCSFSAEGEPEITGGQHEVGTRE